MEEGPSKYDLLVNSLLSDTKNSEYKHLYNKKKMEEAGISDEQIAKQLKKKKKNQAKRERRRMKGTEEYNEIDDEDEDNEEEDKDAEDEDDDDIIDDDWIKTKQQLEEKEKNEKEEKMKSISNNEYDLTEEDKKMEEDTNNNNNNNNTENDDDDDDDTKKKLLLMENEEEDDQDTYKQHYEVEVKIDKTIIDQNLPVSKLTNELSADSSLGKVVSDQKSMPTVKNTCESFKVKQRLREPWKSLNSKNMEILQISNSHTNKQTNDDDGVDDSDETNKATTTTTTTTTNTTSKEKFDFTPLQSQLFTLMNNYNDVLYTNRNHHNANQIRNAYMLHCINHSMKTRDRIIRHNQKLSNTTNDDLEIRDQGFTRPKVLLLLPTRNDCLEAVETLFKLSPKVQADRIANKKKFYMEFYEETYVPLTRKPDDFLARFRGNLDDAYRLGISFTQKYIKLYSEFYHSDILIASPLGLRLSIESNRDDFDFLSSIELVVVDQMEMYFMQNWEHILYIFKKLNQMPKKSPDTDINRIRSYYLEGQAKFYRQTVIFSEIFHVDINSLFNKLCYNVKGKFKIIPNPGLGTITKVVPQVKHLFQRLNCNSVTEVDDLRFNYFTQEIFPHLLQDIQKGVLIFFPTYFDYVRVRNFFRTKQKQGETSFVQLCEYSKSNHVSRARSYFFSEKREMMLMTERFHFFNRYVIRGIKKIIFYAPPSFSKFYPEILNMMPEHSTSLVIFTKFDVYQLDPLLGSKRSSKLITSDKSHHMFC
eukprot:TRINITY_DN1172_c1_g2_i1.p1 TRINITY_DN1172_c1_g2~~TRINITY_DN1172_c1_g2_i1.p1  ORF type:complete len:843 (+),score=269.32 TRINITY_DN1172_c1_g2_i1:255-2531(+)